MKIALAQINTKVGDFLGNAAKICQWSERAAAAGADVVIFPELTINGYPPRDLLQFQDFVVGGEVTLRELAKQLRGGPPVLVGFVESSERQVGLGMFNSVAWLESGAIQCIARKTLLPNYDVFDEARYFDSAEERTCHEFDGVKFGLSICEDGWNDPNFWGSRRYDIDPVDELVQQGCDVIINASASPFSMGKPKLRREMFQATARSHRRPLLMCNLVGGNDSLIFDGHSLVIDAQGKVLQQGAAFAEDLLLASLAGEPIEPTEPVIASEVLQALTLGVRDYVGKTGFRKAVVGLSGGIDSALTVVIAARALGPENVMGVSMPSRFTSQMSEDDAAKLAKNLGIEFHEIAIEPIVQSFEAGLKGVFDGMPRDITEENLQARARGVLLMGISNKLGHLVLTTGNKSELAVGYCTLYGDMCGALGVIGDLPKTLVYQVAEFVNEAEEVIPRRILVRPPTAELREDQKDEDSLPPYAELDPLLDAMIIDRQSGRGLRQRGFAQERIERIQSMLLRAEYKRRQAAPILRVTRKAFGVGWRFPIAHGWRPTAVD